MAKVNTQNTLKKLAETIVSLSLKEVQELTNILEEEHGIQATSVAPAITAAPSAQVDPAESQGKATFDVILTAVGPNKLQVIKKIKELLNLPLKEAKDATEAGSLPNTLFTNEPKAKAEDIQKTLQEVGATVELK